MKNETRFRYEDKAARGISLLKYDTEFLKNHPYFFHLLQKSIKKERKGEEKEKVLKALFSGRKPRALLDRVNCPLLKWVKMIV